MNTIVSQENFRTDKFILVEVSTLNRPSGPGEQYNLPDIPELRFEDGLVFTNGLQIFTDGQLATSPGGLAVLPAAEVVNAVLVLTVWVYGKSEERIVRIPLFDLVSSSNGGYIRALRNLPVILTKSYIETLNGNVTNDIAYILGLHYFTQRDYEARMSAKKTK